MTHFRTAMIATAERGSRVLPVQRVVFAEGCKRERKPPSASVGRRERNSRARLLSCPLHTLLCSDSCLVPGCAVLPAGVPRNPGFGSLGVGTRKIRNQNSEGLAEPPSKDVFTFAMVCVPSFPPQENNRYTIGKPPARSVSPVE